MLFEEAHRDGMIDVIGGVWTPIPPSNAWNVIQRAFLSYLRSLLG